MTATPTVTDLYNLVYLYNHAIQTPSNNFPVSDAKLKRDALIKILDEKATQIIQNSNHTIENL